MNPSAETRGNHPHKQKSGLGHVWKATGYSLAGLAAAIRHEYAFRLELALAAFLLPAAFFLPVDATGRALMIGAVLLVLIIELVNSAIEAAVDCVSLEENELARRAKDFGSAAVMLSLLNAAAVWVLVLVTS